MIKLLTDIVIIVTNFQLILVSLVLITQKTGRAINRNLLVTFFLTKSFLLTRWFIFRFLVDYKNYFFLAEITFAPFILLAPILYLYIKSLCYKNFALKIKDLFHLFPFISMLILLAFDAQITLFYSPSELSSLEKFINDYSSIVFWSSNLIQIFLYLLAMFRTLRHYRSELEYLYSSVEKVNLNWVNSLMGLIFLHWIFVVSRSFFSIIPGDFLKLKDVLDLFSITIFLVFTTFLILKGLAQLKFATGINEKHKYGSAKLPEPDLNQYAQKLTNFMQTQKPYLDPSLTIEELSDQLALPSWQLSQVINERFNHNFYNFVNQYRVEEVKNKFTDPNLKKKTVLEILYDTGFNSKSTFNSVFKKYTGMTPTEFRKVNQN